MGRSVKMLGMSLSVALFLLAGVCVAQQESGEQILALLEKGIRHYQEGDYAEARSALEEVIALKPGSQAALYVWEKAEMAELLQMVEQEEVAPAVARLMEVLTEALREKKRSVEGIEKLLTDFQSEDTVTYARARNRLIGYGPYAIPYLLDFLALEGEANHRVYTRTEAAIVRMGRAATLPLVEALASDSDILKIHIAGILAQLGDERAVPALLAVAEDEGANEAVRNAAVEAVQSIAGKSAEEVGPALVAYCNLARAYLEEDADTVGYLGGACTICERGVRWRLMGLRWSRTMRSCRACCLRW